MDLQQNMRAASQLRKVAVNQSHAKYEESSGDRLTKSVERKFRTTFIGALSYFEDAFGYLWGHRLPEDELTDDQYHNRRIWDGVRTQVLNNGNNQLRAAQQELAEYTVEWNRHRINHRFPGQQ